MAKKKKANIKVLVAFIQDRSASMATRWSETLEGYRMFLKELKEGGEKDGIDYVFSLTTFDTLIDTPAVGKPISEMTGEELRDFGPRGNTALYDAAGLTIESISKNRHGAEKIICVIVTDGEENSSKEWTKDGLNKVIDAKLSEGDWTFTYLGTQPETWGDAYAVGVGAGSTAIFTQQMSGKVYGATAAAAHSHSVSDQMGTRSLYSDYANRGTANVQRMARAQMSVHVDVPVSTLVFTPPIPAPKIDVQKRIRVRRGGRWR